jgi:hypothetical protein
MHCPYPTTVTIKRDGKRGPKSSAVEIRPEDEILEKALGAPTRRVLERAEALGPKTGWKDGHLSASHGFCPPDPTSSPLALSKSPG